MEIGAARLDRKRPRSKSHSDPSVTTLTRLLQKYTTRRSSSNNSDSSDVVFTAFAHIEETTQKGERSHSVTVMNGIANQLDFKELLAELELSIESSSLSSLEDLPATDLCSTEL